MHPGASCIITDPIKNYNNPNVEDRKFSGSLGLLVPIEPLLVIVGLLVEHLDGGVDVLGDAVVRTLEDGLLDRLGQEHVLIGVRLEHSFEEQRPPLLLQLGPILLAGLVELVPIGHVPERLDVEGLYHLAAGPMDATVVEE